MKRLDSDLRQGARRLSGGLYIVTARHEERSSGHGGQLG